MEPNHPPASPTNAESASLPRCRHISRTGKHCRYLAISWGNQFCKTHVKPPDPTDPLLCAQLADIMQEDVPNFQSAEPLTSILYTIFFALAEGRITERRAAVMCGIVQTVLRTQHAIAAEEKAAKAAAAERLAAEPWRRLPECLWPEKFRPKPDTSAPQTTVATSPNDQKKEEATPSQPHETSDSSASASSDSATSQNPIGKLAQSATANENKLTDNSAAPLAKLPQENRKPDSPTTSPTTNSPVPPTAAKPAPTAPRPTMNYASSMTPPYIPQWPLPRPTPHEQADLDAFDRLTPRGSVPRPSRFAGFGRPKATWRGG
jgi:hypothetical protein